MFTKEHLKKQLAELGLCQNDTVTVHTSMKAIGEVEGGADTVIDAFCEYLCEGLFLVPTHTWANVGRSQPVYDVRSTPACIGALPRAAAMRRDGYRSLHPTHYLWGHGKGAEDYLRGEEAFCTPCDPRSAYGRLAEMGAKILLIGVGNDKNTFIHGVEEMADLPNRLSPEPVELTVIDHNGNSVPVLMHRHFCTEATDVSRYFVNFEPALVACGAQTLGKLGNAQVRVVDAKKCRDVILGILSRADRDLCTSYLEIPREYYLKP